MQQLLMMVGAVFMLVGGAIFLPLPIPFGAPMLAIGFVMLIAASPAFAKLVVSSRRRWPRFNRMLNWIEERAPKGIAAILRRTR